MKEKILQGNVRAAAKLISNIENMVAEAVTMLEELYPHTGKAFKIGITGSPGAGKSTLIDGLVDVFREHKKSVGVLAIDPTSPFTGGALLGDRIRMKKNTLDEGVMYRSMASRGSWGGLSSAAYGAMNVMDAMGKDYILVETVGVGQGEVDVANYVHVSIVVLAPGMGDDIQTLKAGILEIGDIFVINKADRGGVERLNVELQGMLSMQDFASERWIPRILLTESANYKGIRELVGEIYQAQEFVDGGGSLRAPLQRKAEFELAEAIKQNIMRRISFEGETMYILEKLKKREIGPDTAAKKVIENLFMHPNIGP